MDLTSDLIAWSLSPETAKSDGLMPEGLILPDRPVALSMTDAAATAAAVASYDGRMIGTPSYYSSAYPTAAGYNMYGSGTQSYYSMPSTFRTATTPFQFATAQPTYYGGSFSTTGFDYSPYPTAVQCYGGRNNYYSNAVNPITTSPTIYNVGSLSTEPGSSNQLSPFPKAELKKTGKSVKKKKLSNGGGANSDTHYKRIFIWEIGDLCALTFYFANSDPIRNPHRLPLHHYMNANAERIMSTVFRIDQSDECDHMNIEDANLDDSVSDMSYTQTVPETSEASAAATANALAPLPMSRSGADWMRKLAAKYQTIKETYSSYKDDLSGILQQSNISSEEFATLRSTGCDLQTQRWITSITQCLKLINERSFGGQYANIVLTNESIVATLARLLLFEQSSTVPAENVYSYRKTGKEAAIDRIVSRFGKKCSYVMISSHNDTQEIAKRENIPCWPLKTTDNLSVLHFALKVYLTDG
uniref:Eyes absent homolog n=1 Tax=Syphacia muris TaxID=451379 RepID=A0A158R5V9_9BILA